VLRFADGSSLSGSHNLLYGAWLELGKCPEAFEISRISIVG
jgi:hypothetical protein